jgi:hypothetical protein
MPQDSAHQVNRSECQADFTYTITVNEGSIVRSQRSIRGTTEVSWFGLASLSRLLSSDLVIHVGRNERHWLPGGAGCEHLISGDIASANGHK